MTACTLDSSVVDWVIDHPETGAVFETWRIEQSCAGKSLDYACRERGIDPRRVLADLHRAIAAAGRPGGTTP
ncbi:DUF542 domain-containing protein [Limnoglobus roseus]|uniref:Uncharacterized protein n=1 Tax=Limnoglobus roseus TaxID=2598579 RepID=A0A5C1AAH4_9BACT|nr:DUF542 domain-containing protein [Limnoglobus roseus]QEL15026.1 hypothetical protein PX52LOC_01931 [Limnoglobus roseus]